MLPNGTGCDGVSPCIALQHSNGAEHAMSRHRGDAALPFNHRIRVMRCRPVKFVKIVGLPVRKPDLTCLHACHAEHPAACRCENRESSSTQARPHLFACLYAEHAAACRGSGGQRRPADGGRVGDEPAAGARPAVARERRPAPRDGASAGAWQALMIFPARPCVQMPALSTEVEQDNHRGRYSCRKLPLSALARTVVQEQVC